MNIIEQNKNKINGILETFDRMIINGYLLNLCNYRHFLFYLIQNNIKLKDFDKFALEQTSQLCNHIDNYIKENNVETIYLNSGKIDKNEIVMNELNKHPNKIGLITALSVVEVCNTMTVKPNYETEKLEVISKSTKCKHYYFYYNDDEFGLMFLKIQTWFPYNVQIYINGREYLSKLLDKNNIKYDVSEDIIKHIAVSCGGDVRKAVNTVELSAVVGDVTPNGITVTMEAAKALAQRSNMKYDRDGDQHYDNLSALQKSIRGSDENAALHYAARLMAAGDIISLSRRLLVIASEDVGLAYPNAVTIVKSCVDSAMQLGLPEARIPLAQAVVLLATAPKSNSVYEAINMAMEDVNSGLAVDFPRCLQNKHFDGEAAKVKGQFYKYPHSFPNHWVEQQYLPDTLKDRVYYNYGENKYEQATKLYWSKIKGGK